MSPPPASLVLVPAWLDEATPPEDVLAQGVLDRIRSLRHFVVEEPKSARRFLAACRHPGPLRDLHMHVLDEHTRAGEVPALLEPARKGHDLGLLSEAGMPAVADPGAPLIALAHREGIPVVPLPGPSSILLALAASGLGGQRFRFVGYLPAKTSERLARIREIEARSARDGETQIFIETPYRNEALISDLLGSCSNGSRLAVAANLTGSAQVVVSRTIGQWKATRESFAKVPAVFLLRAGSE